MASNDEWWRHDDRDALDARPRRSVQSGSSTPKNTQPQREQKQFVPEPNRTSYTVKQQSSQTTAHTSSSNSSYRREDGPRYSEDVIAPWREKDRTSHLDAMRTKRNSRARSSQYVQYKTNEQGIPQFRDTTARRGGWNIPSLNGGSKPNAGTNSSIFGSGRRVNSQQIVFIVAAILALLLVFFVLRGIVGCVSSIVAPAQVEEAPQTEAAETAAVTNSAGTTSGVSYTVLDENRTTASGMGRVSFSAVGDNLMNSNLLTLADGWAGSVGDREYDFSPFYTEIAGYIQNWIDVSFINQETTLGGTDNFDYAGYPSYNTPDSLADAVANAGWRIVNLNTNHTYDTWVDSIVHNLSVWAQKTNLITVGSYENEEARQTINMVECNGIRIAVLSYCYGQNGYEQSDLPNTYYAVPWDEEAMKSDVARAREVADAVIVYMHAGTEYTNEPSDQEKEIAQACANNGVDVVIGSHAHVIQPVEWVERSDGSGKMLCAYGLGDFVSGYTNYPEVVLSGMLTFDFVRADSSDSTSAATGEDASTDDAITGASASTSDNVGPGGIAVENVVWHPLIEHMVGDTDTVRFVSGYSDEDARANELLSTLDDPLTWIKETTQDVIGDEINIDM